MTDEFQQPVDVVLYDPLCGLAYVAFLKAKGLSAVAASTIEEFKQQAASRNGTTTYVFDSSTSRGYDSRPAKILDDCGVSHDNRIAYVASYDDCMAADSSICLMKGGELGSLVNAILKINQMIAKK